jgi:hypothetical protein
MKNDTHPLYTLLRDPKPIATNGSAKKRTTSLRKKILLGGIIAVALGVSIWQLREYQQREQFITWVAKYRPGWSSGMIKAEWDKIQYAKQHAEIVAPVPTVTHAPIPAAVLVPLNSEPKESPKPADIPGGYWVESDNPQIGWHWIKGSPPSKSGRFANQ